MATGDILSVVIRSDGWSADVTIEGFTTGASYNPGLGTNNVNMSSVNAKIKFTVTSLGFDTSGNATTRTRDVYGTKTIRKPYPNQAQMDETVSGSNIIVRVGLSEYIYAKDKSGAGNSGTDVAVQISAGWATNSGGGAQTSNAYTGTATNNSTENYPKVIGRWVWPGYERITGDWLVEAMCFHAYARNGKPVACVQFDLRDASSNSAPTVTVTDMTLTTRTGDAIRFPVYAATLNTSGLTDGQVITGQFKAFPWIGDAAATLDTRTTADGVAAPSEDLTPLMGFLDRADSRAVYVSVATSAGATPTVSTSKATARANPYGSLMSALNAAKSWRNTNQGENTVDHVVVLMQAGTHAGPGTFTGGSSKSWCVIKSDDENGVTRDQVIFGTATNQTIAGYYKFENVTLQGNTGPGFLRGDINATQWWLDRCDCNCGWSPPMYGAIATYVTRNYVRDFIGGFVGFSTTSTPGALFRGNSGETLTTVLLGNLYCFVGNSGRFGPSYTTVGNNRGDSPSDNAILAYNRCMKINSTNWGSDFQSACTKGIAVVCNLVEKTSTGAALLRVWADSNTSTPARNLLWWHNTMTGPNTGDGRVNMGYNDTGSLPLERKLWFIKFTMADQWNSKADLFGTPDGNRVGNWPILFGVATKGLKAEFGANFPGEWNGFGSTYTATLGYTNSLVGSGGGGDYTLTSASSGRNAVPAGEALIPFDLAGNPYNNAGFGSAGAYQRLLDIPPAGGSGFFFLN